MNFAKGKKNWYLDYAFFPCECGMHDHHLIVERFNDAEKETDPPLYSYEFLIALSPYLPWYKRVWLAVKYVFGFDKRHTAYHSVMLKEEDFHAISSLFDK